MGQGLEGALPDGKLGRILDNAFYPSASTGNLDQAFQATYSEVFALLPKSIIGTVICQRKQTKRKTCPLG